MTRRARFDPAEPCAIDPKAWGLFFDIAPPPEVTRHGDIALVTVRGPLMHHESWMFDSYDAIKARIVSCLATEKPRAIVMAIDSPGGLVSGCFDTCEEITAACESASVPLYAYVDGQACSAAYALACSASLIAIPATGTVGSIGCVAELVSFAKMESGWIDRRIITSGARKADGNPSVPITDEAEAAVRAQVMQLAQTFFEHVASSRPMQVDEIRGLEAAVVIGARAVPALADELMSLDEMLEAIATGEFGSASRSGGEETMPPTKKTPSATRAEGNEDKSPYEQARDNLKKAAEGDDDEAKKAKKALEAMDDDESTAEGDGGGDADEGDGKEKKKETEGVAAAVDARFATLESAFRAELLAARPDLDAPTRKVLGTAPLADVRAYLEAHPKRTAKPSVATTTVLPTRGEGQENGGDNANPAPAAKVLTAEEKEARQMRIRMGLEKRTEADVVVEGSSFVVGGFAPE